MSYRVRPCVIDVVYDARGPPLSLRVRARAGSLPRNLPKRSPRPRKAGQGRPAFRQKHGLYIYR